MVVSHRKWASFLRVIILVCRSAVEIESTTLTEKRQGRSCKQGLQENASQNPARNGFPLFVSAAFANFVGHFHPYYFQYKMIIVQYWESKTPNLMGCGLVSAKVSDCPANFLILKFALLFSAVSGHSTSCSNKRWWFLRLDVH